MLVTRKINFIGLKSVFVSKILRIVFHTKQHILFSQNQILTHARWELNTRNWKKLKKTEHYI